MYAPSGGCLLNGWMSCRIILDDVGEFLMAQPAPRSLKRLWASDVRKADAAALMNKLNDFVSQLEVSSLLAPMLFNNRLPG